MYKEYQKMIVLELTVAELQSRVERLENRHTKFVTPKELSKLMHCSVSHIYKSIQSGKIHTVDIAGIRRIPLSQFYKDDRVENIFPRGKSPEGFMDDLRASTWE